MAFVQQPRTQSGRQTSYHAPEATAEAATTSPQLKRSLDQSEEWVLFSPTAPSATTRTHTTSTQRTPRTAGLSRFSEFGSLETAARSDQDDDAGTFLGTEEDLDSLDDGLHAFHEPSEYGAPASRLQQNSDTVLPTHDGLGEFEPNATMQEHMWQFERPRRRVARRRSSVQRHFTILDNQEMNTEQEKWQRIEKWRLEQSKALLEEIEKETRRRRRMSTMSATRNRVDSVQKEATSAAPQTARSVSDAQSESSEEGTENMSFWQRITRRVIRDLIGLDEDTLSVIFGESLPEEATTPTPTSPVDVSADKALQDAGVVASRFSNDTWQTKLLERVAQELGTLVNQLSEHPGAFSTYQRTPDPDSAGLAPIRTNTSLSSEPTASRPSSSQPTTSPASVQFAPTYQPQTTQPHTYSEASLWGIEEESTESTSTLLLPTTNIAEDLAREREYWESEIDVKMIFNFLMKRFSSRRPSISSPPQSQTLPEPPQRRAGSVGSMGADDGASSARRAAIIRQHHPLVNRTTDSNRLPTSSTSRAREPTPSKRYATYYAPGNALRERSKLRSSSSCVSQSTKKSKRSGSSARNYWDLGSSVGSVAGEV